jgi:molybdopterin molybdotransferase
MAVCRFDEVRMRGFRALAAVEAVTALIDCRSHPLAGETVSVGAAAGRVLTDPIVAGVAVPGFDRAAMDGYALQAPDTAGAAPCSPLGLVLAGESLPGRAFSGLVRQGQAVRIMTGAPLPDGADAVLPVEFGREEAGRLQVGRPVSPGQNVSRRGEDVAPGCQVLSPGRRLRPQDLGLLRSIGVPDVSVVRSPRVEILITGDELLPPGALPEGHRIVDSNSTMLAALVARDGGELAKAPSMLPDQPDRIRTALASSDADVVLVSGGSSVGREDHAPFLVAELGKLLVHGIAVRPASPTGFAVIGRRLVFLLPGNPVSCLCAYDLFAGLAVRCLAGRAPELPYRTRALPLARPITSVVGRTDVVRVRIQEDHVEPLLMAKGTGASLLSSVTQADGFVTVPDQAEGYMTGDIVQVFVYDG